MLKATIHRAWSDQLADDDPDASWLEQEGFEDRLEAYRNGDFHLIGIRACAEIRFETEQGGWITGPTLRSAGIWGVESDSDETYIAELVVEQCAELGAMLRAFHMWISDNAVTQLILDSAELPFVP